MTTPNKEDMLRKVRALLAKAEAEGTTPQEAELLTAKATELMAKYGIDEALAKARAHANAKPSDKVFLVEAPYAQPKAHLLHAVAKALHCSAVTIQTRGANERVHVFGFESDLELVEMLYTSLLLQMSHAVAKMYIPTYLRGRSVMAERRSFMLGFTSGVRPRLEEAYALAVSEADDTGTTGKELVLASRDVAVRSAMESMYPSIRKTRTTYRGGGYGSGQQAGRTANIHDRPGVGARSRAIGR